MPNWHLSDVKSVNSNFVCFDWPNNLEYPWLFTVLHQEPRWCLVLRHFQKTKLICVMNEAVVQTNIKRATNFGMSLFTGRQKIIFMLNEMFVNFKQSSYYKREVLSFKELLFFPTDLVNTKTTFPLKVGEQRQIYTLSFRLSVQSYFEKGCWKNVHATIPKGNMGYDQYTVSDDCSCRIYLWCFPLKKHMSMAMSMASRAILSNFFEEK